MPTRRTDNCIESVPIFANLSQAEMLEIAYITRPETFQKGELVYSPGDHGGRLYVLHKGKIKITRVNRQGKEQVIRILGPGDFMGELSLFGAIPQTDQAEVLETATMCVIEGDQLKELMAKYASIAFKVMDVLSRRLERAEHLIESISLDTVEQRLAKVLLELGEGSDEIRLATTKGDLASSLGMTQETLSRKLKQFEAEGLIALKGHKGIRLLDRDQLLIISERD